VHPAADIPQVLETMEGICSDGSEEDQREKIAALLRGILRFSSCVHHRTLKACVIIVAEMLAILQGESTYCAEAKANFHLVNTPSIGAASRVFGTVSGT